MSLYPSDWMIVDEQDQKYDLGTSAALRMIIRQWRELRAIQDRTLTDRDAVEYEVQ